MHIAMHLFTDAYLRPTKSSAVITSARVGNRHSRSALWRS
jgi:hypothetical protein